MSIKYVHDIAEQLLLDWQPTAVEIEFDECEMCGYLMLSYHVPGHTRRIQWDEHLNGWTEDCGYFCSRCDFGNGGRRLINDKVLTRLTY